MRELEKLEMLARGIPDFRDRMLYLDERSTDRRIERAVERGREEYRDAWQSYLRLFEDGA